ncbi:polysaccharide biosynthesis/export family protein [Caulobacter sp. DWP3-1-3b2]|uniref:polysaccharide biosynthesis/export family protein n=1 Tax=Caulobacter sp. DWP3-1-3b2 TaxID=2804643 RepID=UPI003CFA1CC6
MKWLGSFWLLIALAFAPLMSVARAQSITPAPASAMIDSARNVDYILGAGDKIRVIVFGEPSLSGEFEVSGSGMIAFPLVGQLTALGISTSEFQARVAAALRDGYIKDPRVSVEVLNYRPFYILGEVTKPGEYPYTNGLTVMKAVATANGFTYRADTRKVFIKRANDDIERQISLDAGTMVLPGDTIRVKERYF